jgi:peptidoglycan/LPS O-acetylase OafA/YrhL
MEYRKEIDGLRAIALIPVILFHAGFQFFGGGFVGVDIFFVISGYLITTVIITEIDSNKFSIKTFYERRARRILPALFFVMFVCFLFAWFGLRPGELKELSRTVIAVTTYLPNVFFWRTTEYFATEAELNPLLHTWSLGIEEQFYFLFPIFLLLTWRFSRRFVVLLLAVVFIMSLSMAQWTSFGHVPFGFFMLPTRGWELLVGSFIAFYLSNSNRVVAPLNYQQIGGLVGVILLAFSITSFDRYTPFPSLYTLVPTLGAALIILFATEHTIVGKLLGTKPFVGIGLISYSAYLWHQPLFAFARYTIADKPSQFVFGTLACIALVLGYLTWKYIEAPFRNKRAFTSNQVFILAAFVSLLFIAFSVATIRTNGFLYRYKTENDRILASLVLSEAGEYVAGREETLRMKPFNPQDSRKKILIIGDSYSQDLVNALYERGIADKVQITTRHIPHRCGNIFSPRREFEKNIAKEDLSICKGNGLYEDAELRKLMLASDEIWLASRWRAWQAGLLPASVSNIKMFSSKPVTVFGSKNFGEINLNAFLLLNEQARISVVENVDPEAREVNEKLKKLLSPDIFVNVQGLLCGDDINICHAFNKNGELLSFDGGHLTKFGAEKYGEQLLKSGRFKRFYSNDENDLGGN